MELLPQGLSLPFGDGGAEEGGGTSGLRLYRLARIFGKFLANDFFSGRSGTGKSENDRINILSDLLRDRQAV